jgi:glycolate oxidase FAD binding subunit
MAEHRPESEEALAAIVAQAARSSQPLRILGGGTRAMGNPVDGEVLSTSGLSGVELYEPGALTLVVRAGTPVAEVEALLARERQRLPFEPMDHRPLLGTTGEPTIGGVAAVNASGPRRVQAGAARDFMLGVRFVDGTGAVVRNGGRVMKNVTGYDLVKLMAGSWGTLGVLTEVAFKVLPAPDASATISVEAADVEAAVAALSAALASPYEVTGAAWQAEAGAMVRIEGFEASVAYRAGALTSLLAPLGPVALEKDPDRVAELWAGIRDAAWFTGSDRDVWRIAVRPSAAAEMARRLDRAELALDRGGALVWAAVARGTDLRARLDGVAAEATLVRADAATRRRLGTFPPENAAVAALSRGLRRRFDPRGILNPGLWSGGTAGVGAATPLENAHAH